MAMGSVLGFPGVDPADAAVGARLKRWREARGMEVDALAGFMALSVEAVRRAESGRAHLSSLDIAAATACLHLPVWALVSDQRAY
jgi:transcriptional regulator with XRE-family HTH domain